MYEVDFSILLNQLELIFIGIKTTLFICAVSILFSFIIGSFLFLLRWQKYKILRKISAGITELIRNIPLLIIIYLLYKGLPQAGVTFSALWCGIIALSVYTGVYIADNLRSGANSVHAEQKQAALSLGLNDIQTFIYIIYPQTLRNVIIPIGSQFINLLKNSSLVSFIAVTDIFYVVFQGISEYFRVIEFMVLGIVLYGGMSITVSIIANFLDRHYKIKLIEG